MYLVRKLDKTGEVQVYSIDEIEGDAARIMRRRKPRAWHFNKGIAAIAESTAVALSLIYDKELEHAALVA